MQIGSNLARTWAKAYLAAKQSKKVRVRGGKEGRKEGEKWSKDRTNKQTDGLTFVSLHPIQRSSPHLVR